MSASLLLRSFSAALVIRSKCLAIPEAIFGFRLQFFPTPLLPWLAPVQGGVLRELLSGVRPA